MKITKRQLRRIIKEEKTKILSEQNNVPQRLLEDLDNAMYAILKNLETYGDMDPQDVAPAAVQIIQNELNGFYDATGTGPLGESATGDQDGTLLDDMPDSWRQILGDRLDNK